MTAPKRSQRTAIETLEDLVLRFRLKGATAVSVCVGEDSLQVQWPEPEQRDRTPAIGSGLPVSIDPDSYEGKVGFQ